MDVALRTSAAHVFVDSLADPQLGAPDAHHLRRVLRIRPADPITISDGAGSWTTASLVGERLEPTGEIRREPHPAQLTIAASIPKGERLEWMVQKLTELGVDGIVLVDCSRSVVRWEGPRAERQLARLGRVAREAAMQSRRVWLPAVGPLITFAAAAEIDGAVLADAAGVPLSSTSSTGRGAVIVGPEGGFTDDELGCGLPRVSLSVQVLRVETAAIAAAAIVLGRAAEGAGGDGDVR